MRIVFFGTPEWALASLDALLGTDHEIRGVVSNPDRPAGRGYEMQPPPVKIRAQALSLGVLQPSSARDPEFSAWLAAQEPDLAIVVAYGKILPASLLEIPRLGFLNVHFSLLPAYRGAAPVQRAVMDGLTTTGVTIMKLTPGMDEGPVVATRELDIGAEETAGELGTRLAVVGAELLVETLDPYAAGELSPREQEHDAATYAPKITSEEARIDWSHPAEAIRNKVRGLNPMPGAWTTMHGARLKIHRAAEARGGHAPPGSLEVDPHGRLVVATGEDALVLTEVQPAGKRRMAGEELARGLRPSEEMTLV